MIDTQKVRYLLSGVLNTLFGYGIGIVIYKIFSNDLHIVFIGVIANILSISFSFFVYKLFVFKTQGHWLKEYFKSYCVYGFSAALGTAIIWFLMNRLTSSIWIAQGIALTTTMFASYLGHSRFTFRRNALH